MKKIKGKTKPFLSVAIWLAAALTLGTANMAQAAYIISGQVNLDGSPANGAAVSLTNLNTSASSTLVLGPTGIYSFDLDALSASSTNGDLIRIDAGINGLTASTSVVYDTGVSSIAPPTINIVTPILNHAITASAGPNGTITPSGTVTVNNGASQSFAIAPNAGFAIADVLVDNASVGASSTYDFANVTADHTIAASFKDAIAPVITLKGASSTDVVINTVFNDPGVTATDNLDGDVTANVVATGTVNTAVLGQYTVTYNVSDSAGNAAIPVQRTVNVIAADVTPPVITLLGSNPKNVNLNTAYVDPGATAFDNVDGDLTSKIVASGTVDTAVPGQYFVTYTVSDAASNTASSVRTVNVQLDITPPVITLIGSSTINVPLNSTFTDPGATAFDNVDENVTSSLTATGTVNTSIPGAYTITYVASDKAGNTATTTRTVNVLTTTDTTPPVITLNGSSTMEVLQNSTFVDPGATAADDTDGNLTSSIIATGTVNTAVLGQYKITYSVTDKASNTASTTRTVNVVASTTPPSSGTGGGGGGGTFIPSTDNVPPGYPTNVKLTKASNGYTISWQNPTDSDFQGVRLIRKAGSAPQNINDGTILYENGGGTYTDTTADMNTVYYYGLAAYDKSGNFSQMVVANTENDVVVLGESFYLYSQYKNLASLSSTLADTVSAAEGSLIFGNQSSINLSSANLALFNRLMGFDTSLTANQRNVLANFIQNGSPTTRRLGAGERAGVISSFVNAYGALPKSATDYQNVIKIANGRWPGVKNTVSENKAMSLFKTIYKRSLRSSNSNDTNALMVIAYGLRPVNRNMNSERAAIAIFKNIYKHAPSTTSNWDLVRAIAYSGAKR